MCVSNPCLLMHYLVQQQHQQVVVQQQHWQVIHTLCTSCFVAGYKCIYSLTCMQNEYSMMPQGVPVALPVPTMLWSLWTPLPLVLSMPLAASTLLAPSMPMAGPLFHAPMPVHAAPAPAVAALTLSYIMFEIWSPTLLYLASPVMPAPIQSALLPALMTSPPLVAEPTTPVLLFTTLELFHLGHAVNNFKPYESNQREQGKVWHAITAQIHMDGHFLAFNWEGIHNKTEALMKHQLVCDELRCTFYSCSTCRRAGLLQILTTKQ
jgi:hypothetical protein